MFGRVGNTRGASKQRKCGFFACEAQTRCLSQLDATVVHYSMLKDLGKTPGVNEFSQQRVLVAWSSRTLNSCHGTWRRRPISSAARSAESACAWKSQVSAVRRAQDQIAVFLVGSAAVIAAQPGDVVHCTSARCVRRHEGSEARPELRKFSKGHVRNRSVHQRSNAGESPLPRGVRSGINVEEEVRPPFPTDTGRMRKNHDVLVHGAPLSRRSNGFQPRWAFSRVRCRRGRKGLR